MAKRKGTADVRIDIHSHVIPRRFIDYLEIHSEELKAHVGERDGNKIVVHDQGYVYPLFAEFYDPRQKVAAMDRSGLDVSVVSPAPPLFFYWTRGKLAVDVARVVNDGVAEMVAAFPERLRGMATIPAQDPAAAIAEMDRVVHKYHFRAVEIGTAIEGTPLSSHQLRPILRRAMELGVFLFAHPYYTGKKPGLGNYYLTNLIGNPLDTTVMVADLMFSGALEELPDLRICLAHGGGFLPYQVGRLVHGHQVRSEANVHCKTSPLDLLKRFYFDSLVFDGRALEYLVELVGAEHVCVGTDSPFDMGDPNPDVVLQALAGRGGHVLNDVCCGTAKRLLGE